MFGPDSALGAPSSPPPPHAASTRTLAEAIAATRATLEGRFINPPRLLVEHCATGDAQFPSKRDGRHDSDDPKLVRPRVIRVTGGQGTWLCSQVVTITRSALSVIPHRYSRTFVEHAIRDLPHRNAQIHRRLLNPPERVRLAEPQRGAQDGLCTLDDFACGELLSQVTNLGLQLHDLGKPAPCHLDGGHQIGLVERFDQVCHCLLYTSPSPRDRQKS